MKIRWYGQSCFMLTSSDGTNVLIDPYGKFLGYKMPRVNAEIVVVTHNHRDHNQVQIVDGNYTLVNEAKEYEFNGIRIKGIKTFHDKVEGAKRGDNIVYVFRMDDITICHCGDLGHLLSEEQAREIGKVDVLMVPVGGKMTLNGSEAYEVVQKLQPSIAIPMHYRTKALGLIGMLMFAKADAFVSLVPGEKRHLRELEISRENLGEEATVLTLDYQFDS